MKLPNHNAIRSQAHRGTQQSLHVGLLARAQQYAIGHGDLQLHRIFDGREPISCALR